MLTCQSEFGKVKSVFIKRAKDAFVSEQKVNSEWKKLNFLSKPDLEGAIREYKGFEGILKADRCEINCFPQDDAVSMDSIYCRDASIATDRGMIICNMGKTARISEAGAQRRAFEAAGVEILGSIEAPGTVEGGDVVWLDRNTLAVGRSYRTNEDG